MTTNIAATHEEIRKIIASNNAIFAAADAAGKRVLIAKDVLKRIESRQYIPNSGSWFGQSAFIGANPNDSVQELIVGNRANGCTCCGIGSLFLSCIALNNKVVRGELYEVSGPADMSRLAIGQFFSDSQLEMIETAFELGEGFHSYTSSWSSVAYPDLEYVKKSLNQNQTYEERLAIYLKSSDIRLPLDIREKCIQFGRKNPEHDEARLIGIMKNIVENNGEFVP